MTIKELMLLELAADEQPEEGSAEETEPEAAEEGGTTEEDSTEVEAKPSEYDIDGEKFTVDQIKEWQKGNMRQSDYTKKTQEIAQWRKENSEAQELYNYLKSNPEIAAKLAEISPEQSDKTKSIMNPELEQMNLKMTTWEIEKSLESIMSKDKDVSEIDILNIANERGIDVNSAYDIWRGRNLEKIIEKRLSEQSKSITDKIKSNNDKTKTLITPKNKPIVNHGLSDQQIAYAAKLDMTPEEYKKWM